MPWRTTPTSTRPGMTSHASVNVMLALEGEFDIEFPDHMLKRSVFESIAAMRAAIDELTREGRDGGRNPQRQRRADARRAKDAIADAIADAIGGRVADLRPAAGCLRRSARTARGRLAACPCARTAAAALRAAGAWSASICPPRRFDAEDWWWRARFSDPATTEGAGAETVLGFEGLATVADVWLDGALLFASDNMFVAHERP